LRTGAAPSKPAVIMRHATFPNALPFCLRLLPVASPPAGGRDRAAFRSGLMILTSWLAAERNQKQPYKIVAAPQKRLAGKPNEARLNRMFFIVFLHQRDVTCSAKVALVGVW